MKKLLILLLLLIVNQGFSQKSYKNFVAKKDTALWQLNGANISNKNSGNVGVGTATPTQKLEVIGTAKVNNLQIATPLTANSASPFFYAVLDASGNVLKEPIVSTLSPVLNNTVTTPPTSPSVDDAYLIPAGATGVWAGQTNKIATWSGASWVFYTPVLNDKTSVLTGANVGLSYTFEGTNWVVASVPASNNFALDGNNVTSIKKLGTISNFDLPIITNNVERLRVTTAGNVGIGTASPFGKIHTVLGTSNGNVTDWDGNHAVFGQAGSRGSALGIGYDLTSNESFISTLAPSVAWRPLRFMGAGWKFFINGTNQALTIAPDGNVGVGKITPTSKLDVETGVTTVNSIVNAVGNINDFLQYNIQNTSTGLQSQSGYSATANNGTATTGFAWMGINNSTFNFPTIYNAGTAGDVTYVGSGQDLIIANANQTKAIKFQTGKATTPFFDDRMTILNNGNVGIATTTPANKLHIASTSVLNTGGIRLAMTSATPNSIGQPVGVSAAGDLVTIGTYTGNPLTANNGIISVGSNVELGGDLVKNTNFTGNFNLTTSGTGNIGFGTATPTEKLHINGTGSQNIMLESPSGGPISNILKIRTWSGMPVGTYVGFGGVADGLSSARAGIFVPNTANTGVFEAVSVLKSTGYVGIGTTTPTTKLEVVGQVKITGGVPGVGKVLTSDATGLATWETSLGVGATIGDAKSGFQTGDHGGWILLDGRAKTALTAIQQTRATSLGIGANIPNATGRTFTQGTLMAQIGSTAIALNQLPNYVPNLSIGTRGVATGSNYNMYSSSGNFSGASATDIAMGSINGNQTQQAYTPASIGVNQFIYLGL